MTTNEPIDLVARSALDALIARVRDLETELSGARATIAHLSESMSWISGHDRQGLDHLDEMMQASRERDAAEAAIARVRKLCRAAVTVQFTRNGVPVVTTGALEQALEGGA